MTLARTYSVALIGVRGHVVEVEADIASGLPATVLVGLPDTALREARDRIRAAINNSGAHWPSTKITVGLSPASLPKRGSGFDAAIAIGLLAADSKISADRLKNLMFYAELGLDGQLRPVNGVLPAVLAAKDAGLTTMVVSAANAAEAALVPDVTVVAASSLGELILWLHGGPAPRPPAIETVKASKPKDKDMSDVLGQADARFAVEVCAAGGHNLSLLGPPGAGKTMLAERMPGILPALDTRAALEVTSIHSVAGELQPDAGLVTRPPFCAPHHTASKAAIVGGGSGQIRPGAASLAHNGILFLDEAPEFDRDVLDALRQPLESGEVVIARLGICAAFPARFALVLAANPCPCAKANSGICECAPAARRRYQAKLSGPLLDRVDVKVELQPVARADILHNATGGEPTEAVADRVAQARARAAQRYQGTSWRLNAEIPGAELRRDYPVRPGALIWLDQAMQNGQVTARGADKVMRVAWTLADLAGRDQPGSDEVTGAIGLWLGVAR
jgi:magnesium chelatase family protein